MALPASSATLNVPPALALKPTTAILASIKRSLTLPPKTPNTALLLVELDSTQMALIAEVSSIESQLVCAANCETCSTGAVADCSLCFTSFYLHPTTNACEALCPDAYYEDAPSRTCPQCNAACLTCTASGTLNCPTCASQHFAPAANQCAECDPLCDECTGSGNTACQACAST